MRKRVVRVLAILLFLVSSDATAQQGTVRGATVDAESGIAVPAAYLFLHPAGQPGAGRDLSSAEDGSFAFQKLSAGRYVLQVSRAGYNTSMMELDVGEKEESNVLLYLQPHVYQTEPVVVTGTHMHSRVENVDEISHVLRGKELDRELGLTLAATLKNETGIAMRTMGPAPARPVIRGLGGDRVHLSEDGNKTTDLSASSPDHAVTIEPFAVERIEVLRGPKVLMQSPVTIGGVVNVVRHEIPQDMHGNIIGTMGMYGETANGGLLGAATAEIPVHQFMTRGEFSHRQTGDLRTPEGVLSNSDSRTTSLSFGGSYIDRDSYAGAAYRHFDLEYGIPGGFVGAHPDGVTIALERRQVNARAALVFDATLVHDVTLQLSRAYYRHKEFEATGAIGSEFSIVSYPGRIALSHHSLGPFTEGSAGVNFEYRDFNVGGFVFTSPSTSLNVAPYVYERWAAGPFSLEAALRYNHDVITPLRENPDARTGHIRQRTFHTWSASTTLLFELTDIVHIGMNLSRSSRVPTIEELFSEGPHLAAYSYEVGNPDLEAEHGYGSELFLYHRFSRLYFNINFFRNQMYSYILPRNTGEVNYATFLPIYATTGVDALIYGAEAQAELLVTEKLSLNAALSFSRGSFTGSGEALPQIPPMKGRLGVSWKEKAWRIGAESEFAARQDRVDEFEEETAGYAIVSGYVQYSFTTQGQVHNISVTAENLFDQPYRNHLSRVKVILPEAGRNLRLTYKLHFQL